jgi:hypothetical protein
MIQRRPALDREVQAIVAKRDERLAPVLSQLPRDRMNEQQFALALSCCLRAGSSSELMARVIAGKIAGRSVRDRA